MFRLALLLGLLTTVQTLNAQLNQRLEPVRELNSYWLTADRQGESYTPYVQGTSLNYPVIGFILNTNDNQGLVLRCCVPQGTSIFIDNRIVDRTSSEHCKLYNLDSLNAIYRKNAVFLSFFKENLNPSELSTTLMALQPIQDAQAQTKSTPQIIKRISEPFMDFFVVAIILITSFYAFLINKYPKGHRDFFNFSKAFSLTLKEEKILTQRNMSSVNTMFLGLYSMVFSLLIILFWKIFQSVPELFGFVQLGSFSTGLFSWLALSVIIFCVVELKYMIIKILCSLLNIEKIAQIHFFDFIRISLIFVCSTLIVASSLYLSNLPKGTLFTVILYFFLALLGVRIIILLLKLIGDTSFRKIHLISYLCTTEILPLLIGIRIFF